MTKRGRSPAARPPSSQAPPSDFKRRKAKVGKRAPKKLNETDTSFRSATVSVRPQSVAASAASSHPVDASSASAQDRRGGVCLDLVTSRGNTLETLLKSLSHPSPKVRCSSLRGVRDALSPGSGNPREAVRANLNHLLPHLFRRWVDEDDDVRALSIDAFRDVIRRLSGVDDNSEDGEGKANKQSASRSPPSHELKGFAPLAVAYVASALNSLDDDIRYDGSVLAGILCGEGPSGGGGGGGGGGMVDATSSSVLFPLLPPFVRLLGEHTVGRGGRGSGGVNKKGRGKKGGGNKGGGGATSLPSTKGEIVVRSLVSLLRCCLTGGGKGDAGDYNGNDGARFGDDGNDGAEEEDGGALTLPPMDLSFVPGGRSCNALLLVPVKQTQRRRRAPQSLRMRGLVDLPPLNVDNVYDEDATTTATGGVAPRSSAKEAIAAVVPPDVAAALFDALRSRLVEYTQRGQSHHHYRGRRDAGPGGGLGGEGGGLDLPPSCLDGYREAVAACRFLWSLCHGSDGRCGVGSFESNSNKKARIAATAVKSLLLDSFPLRIEGTSRVETTVAATAEAGGGCASLCLALCELPSSPSRSKSGSGSGSGDETWADAVLEYLLPRLRDAASAAPSSSSLLLVRVAGRLLLDGGIGVGVLPKRERRLALLRALGDAFFSLSSPSSLPLTEEENKGAEEENESRARGANDGEHEEERRGRLGAAVASSPTGRAAALLLARLLSRRRRWRMGQALPGDRTSLSEGNQEDAVDDEDDDVKEAKILLRMASTLVRSYLLPWGGRYPRETSAVLLALLSVVRSIGDEGRGGIDKEDVLDRFGALLRQDILVLFESGGAAFQRGGGVKKRRGKKRFDRSGDGASIFEQLPAPVQRLAINLVGALRSPSCVSSLGRICARAGDGIGTADRRDEVAVGSGSVVSDAMASYIVDILHLIRRTIPMRSYLTFLLDGIGIGDDLGKRVAEVDRGRVLRRDAALGRACRSFVGCGGAGRVIPALAPVLTSWLGGDAKGADATTRLARARAAVAILSAFALDVAEERRQLQVECDRSTVVPSIIAVVPSISAQSLAMTICNVFLELVAVGHDPTDEKAKQEVSRLLSPVATLLYCEPTVLECLMEQVAEVCCLRSISENLINNLSVLIKFGILFGTVRDRQEVLSEAVQSIEKAVANGHLEPLAAKLQGEVKILSGFN